jgi:hypothetical protein
MRFAGIDIAAETHVVAVVDETGTVMVKPTPFTEDAEGYARLLERLGPAAELLVVMEATGHYWKNLFATLVADGIAVALINPLRSRRFAEEDLQRTKTDAIDALGPARFGAQKRPPVSRVPAAATEELRELAGCAIGWCRTSAIACASSTGWSIWASPSSPGTSRARGPQAGVLLLNGTRLNNLSAIDAIPNNAILGFHDSRKAALGDRIAGEVIWNAGTRDGVNGQVRDTCTTKGLTDCYIGRFGWLGDRVSLEDQVANVASVEMNITTTERYNKLYPRAMSSSLSATRSRTVAPPTRPAPTRRATRICRSSMFSAWPNMRAGSATPPVPSSRSLSPRSS